MMKNRIVVFVAVAALLLLGMEALAQTGNADPPMGYTVEEGTISGGGYHLANPAWRVSGAARGGGYQLRGPVAATSSANGCCCTYLPLALRDYQ